MDDCIKIPTGGYALEGGDTPARYSGKQAEEDKYLQEPATGMTEAK